MCPISTQNNTIDNIREEFRLHANAYMPCNPWSNYHDLECGHRIESLNDTMCGTSCVDGGQGNSFICKQCIVEAVEAGVGIREDDEPIEFNRLDIEFLEPLIDPHSRAGGLIEEELAQMSRAQTYRDCKPVPKFDYVAVFLCMFPEAWKEDPRIDEMTRGLQDMTFALDMTDMTSSLEEMKKPMSVKQ